MQILLVIMSENNPLASNVAWGKTNGRRPTNHGPNIMGRGRWKNTGSVWAVSWIAETGRKAYGFGSIFKKIGRAAKKVFKSPIGKAALIGLGGYYLGGTSNGFFRWI